MFEVETTEAVTYLADDELARRSLIAEGNASPTQSEINTRAHQLYSVGAQQFRHGMVQRMDMHKAIERLTK